MNGLGTDVLALACVLGGAAVSGVVTVAALERGDGEPTVCVAVLEGIPAPMVVDVDAEVRVRLVEVWAETEAATARSDFVEALLNEAWNRELQIRQEREARFLEQELALRGAGTGR